MNNTMVFTRPPFLDEFLLLKKFIYYIFLVVELFGVTTNVINIIVFSKTGIRDSVTLSLFFLAVSDLLYIITRIPQTLVFIMEQLLPNYRWPFDLHIFNIISYYYGFFLFNYSCFIAAFVALVRCMCVAKPLVFKSMFTKSRTLKILLSLFVVDAAFHAPLMTTVSFVWTTDSRNFTPYLTYKFSTDHKTIMAVNDIANRNIISWVTYILVTACAIILSIKLQLASEFRKTLTGAKESKVEFDAPASVEGNVPAPYDGEKVAENKNSLEKEKLSTRDVQIVKSVILLCVIFILSQLPTQLLLLGHLVEPELYNDGKYAFLFKIISTSNISFTLINASVNIFIYLNFNSRYRAQFFLLFGKQ